MPRPKTNEKLVKKIWELVESAPKLSAGAIRLGLQRWLKFEPTMRAVSLPTERTIARIKKNFLTMNPEERVQYRYFSWPESMEIGALPWEASRAALELLAHFRKIKWQRPTIQTVRWYWKVTSSAPDLPVEKRSELAMECKKLDSELDKPEETFLRYFSHGRELSR